MKDEATKLESHSPRTDIEFLPSLPLGPLAPPLACPPPILFSGTRKYKETIISYEDGEEGEQEDDDDDIIRRLLPFIYLCECVGV